MSINKRIKKDVRKHQSVYRSSSADGTTERLLKGICSKKQFKKFSHDKNVFQEQLRVINSGSIV